VGIPVFILLSIIAVICLSTGISTGDFTRDPAQITDCPFCIGFLSNIGIVLWGFMASICFFTYAIIKNRLDKKLAFFFLSSGILLTILLIDDLFMIHEIVAPKILLIPEKFIYLFYLMLVLGFYIKSREIIAKSDYRLLIISGAFFAFSVLYDIMWTILPFANYLLEDGTKFMGIALLSTYFFRESIRYIRARKEGD